MESTFLCSNSRAILTFIRFYRRLRLFPIELFEGVDMNGQFSIGAQSLMWVLQENGYILMTETHEYAVWKIVEGKCAEECCENMQESLRIDLSDAIRRFADGDMQLSGLPRDIMLLWVSIDHTPQFVESLSRRDLRAVKAFIFAITEPDAFLTAMRMH